MHDLRDNLVAINELVIVEFQVVTSRARAWCLGCKYTIDFWDDVLDRAKFGTIKVICIFPSLVKWVVKYI